MTTELFDRLRRDTAPFVPASANPSEGVGSVVPSSTGRLGPIAAVGFGLGLQQAIIQRRELFLEHLTPAFWFTALPTTPSLLFASIGSVPLALLNREMRFQTHAVIDAAAALTTLAAAIGSAWLGARYWSLVIGTLAGSVATCVSAWGTAGWTPGRPSLQLPDRGMLGFGANLTGFTIMSFLTRNLDKILIGRSSGSVALGYYDRAYKLLLFPLYNVNAPIARIAIPLLSRIRDDKPRLRHAFIRIAAQVGLLTISGMAALVTTSKETVNVVFGPGWHVIVPIFAWLGLAGLVQPITYAAGWLLIAKGQTAAMFRRGIYSSVTAIASFVVGLHWGVVGVACAYAISDYTLRLPVLYLMVDRVGPVTAFDLFEIQAPFAGGSSVLTALISEKVLLQRYGLDGIYLVGTTILVSYGCAMAVMASLPQGRMVL